MDRCDSSHAISHAKRSLHIVRDTRTLAIMFLIPEIQLVHLGCAPTSDADHVAMSVWHQDRTALTAAQNVAQAQSLRATGLALGSRLESAPGILVRPRVWYNPSVKSAGFKVPGPIGVILSLPALLLAAMTIVREREQGTVEQLVVTPIRPMELIAGRLIPYVLIAFLSLLEILCVGVWWFNVPVNGNLGSRLALAGLFLVASLGLGILISTVSRNRQEAMPLAFFIMLPSVFLSGYYLRVDALPAALQSLSKGIAMTYAPVIARSIIWMGAGADLLSGELLALVALGSVLLVLAAARFQNRLA